MNNSAGANSRLTTLVAPATYSAYSTYTYTVLWHHLELKVRGAFTVLYIPLYEYGQ